MFRCRLQWGRYLTRKELNMKIIRDKLDVLFIITVLIGDDFPELCSDLVAALASLEVDDFSHCDCGGLRLEKIILNSSI